MKAPVFAYTRAESVGHACELLREHGGEARLLAGGQSLVPALNMRLAAPALLVDINGLTELEGVSVHPGGVRLGALARHRSVERSDTIAEHVPLLAQALPHVAHAAIRNRGTLGGSLAYADPAAELPACCLALDATVVLRSVRGTRRVAAKDFFVGLFETAAQPDEILTEVEIPPAPAGRRSVFLEIARRRGDYATIGIAAVGRLDGERWRDLRLAWLGAAPTPCFAPSAAEVLMQQAWCAATLEQAQARLAHDLAPSDDLYTTASTRRHLARVLLARALTALENGPQ